MAFAVASGSQIPLRAFRVSIPLVGTDNSYRPLIDAVQRHSSWLAEGAGLALTGTFTEGIHSSARPDGEPVTLPLMMFAGRVTDTAATDQTVMARLNDLAAELAETLSAAEAVLWYRDQSWVLQDS